MRLYEVMTDTSKDNKIKLLKPTDETFKSVAAFFSHARKNGKKYENKTWILLSERAKPKEIRIKPETQYKIDYGE